MQGLFIELLPQSQALCEVLEIEGESKQREALPQGIQGQGDNNPKTSQRKPTL